jgi:glutamate---cysteine ligase / carboxylate-amine ligase
VDDFDIRSFTLGVEEEYQLIDPASGELRSRALSVLSADWSGEIKEEMQQNTVEVGTQVCADATELHTELGRLRFQTAVAAEARGLRVVAAGVHPYSHWAGQEFTESPVYDRIRREYRRLADSQNIFGLHIHVAVPGGLDRVRLMNVLRHHLPLVLALSASSPVYQGADSGYASYRSILWGRWPRTGSPPRFRDESDYDALVRLLIETGRIDGPGRIYWGIRPHHLYPTLEFRVADVTPRLEDAVAIATFLRALTFAAACGELRDTEQPESVVLPFASENLWAAARDGLAAELVHLQGERAAVTTARERVVDLMERLRPLASCTEDGEGWVALEALVERGSAAARIRERFDGGMRLPALVEWLAEETVLGTGLDRRLEQRDAR